jgi:uncharacterized protein YggE
VEITTKVKNPVRIAAVLAAVVAALMLLAACSPADNDDGATLAGVLSGLSSSQVEALARGASISSSGTTTGIQSTGVGVVRAEPDIATMTLGVETIGATVTEARNEAAIAMDDMLTALRDLNVEDDDLATTLFNIEPQYTFEQITETLANGERISRSERRLVGYRVTNTLSVTIRDLDNLGTVIDTTVDAGDDATRLTGISFTVDDGLVLEVQARTLALQDAVTKADLYASETGVSRGTLVSIVETSGNQFANVARAESVALAFDGAAPTTQILAGIFEVRVTVRVIFDIE